MPYSKERKQEHISQIRRVLVVKPESSILDVKESLEKQRIPLKLDKDYINKLINKIRKEKAKRLDYYTINKVLAEFQDEVEELKRRLWFIIMNAETSERNKIAAIRELRTSSKDLFDKMFDAGVFNRKLGKIEIGERLNSEDKELLEKVLNMDYGDTDNKKEDSGKSGIQDRTGE